MEKKKPYVISGELDLANLDGSFAVKTEMIDAFRINLEDDLRNQGKNVEWVDSERIRLGICRQMGKTSLSILSLDDRYTNGANTYLGISRGVNERLRDIGYVPRVGYASIDKQLNNLSDIGDEVVLVDDVLFSGGLMTEVARELDERGIKVKGVICGVAIGEGLRAMEEIGVDVEAEVAYDEVEDEVCERDFALIAGSGRRVAGIDKSALYFDPEFGRPAEWASINPRDITEFAVRNYERNLPLVSGRIDNFLGLSEGQAPDVMATRLKQLKNED